MVTYQSGLRTDKSSGLPRCDAMARPHRAWRGEAGGGMGCHAYLLICVSSSCASDMRRADEGGSNTVLGVTQMSPTVFQYIAPLTFASR